MHIARNHAVRPQTQKRMDVQQSHSFTKSTTLILVQYWIQLCQQNKNTPHQVNNHSTHGSHTTNKRECKS